MKDDDDADFPSLKGCIQRVREEGGRGIERWREREIEREKEVERG